MENNYRRNAKKFAEAFITGEPETSLENIAMTIPREEWSLCFDNWSHYDVTAGLYESGISTKELMRLVAEVGYDITSSKPIQVKVRVHDGVPTIYSSHSVPAQCQNELARVYNSLL